MTIGIPSEIAIKEKKILYFAEVKNKVRKEEKCFFSVGGKQ